MARIKQLPPHEAHKIAAGEVVERPANVVKELVENALDAQATTISIYVEDAGKKLLRIVDNGHGMDRHDAQLCFKHHATSKISSIDDLTSLRSFGFRGEALSSIASVSRVILTTKEEESAEGVQLTLEGGERIKETSCACTTGTDIRIEDLFFNVPARKKFLRTDDTEWRQIILLFQAFCLDYQEVHFKLFHNNELIHNCPPASDVVQRATQLWGQHFSKSLLSLESEHSANITITGAISHAHYARYDRSQIFFFVNKRWVKNQPLTKALMKGYANVLPQARYPAAFIFIELPAHVLDINIHPRKEEVKFLNPRIVESFVHDAVKKRLEKNISEKIIAPQSSPITFNFDAPVFEKTSFATPPLFMPPRAPAEQPLMNAIDNTMPAEHSKPMAPQEIMQTIAATEPQPYTIIGQFNKTYIVLEQTDGLFLVDQHAAHERILYEQFRQKMHTRAATKLLFPSSIRLSAEDLATLSPYFSLLEEHGIGLEQFGQEQALVHTLPIQIKNIAVEELLRAVVGLLHEHKSMDLTALAKLIHEKLHAQMACKAAVKAGDVLTHDEMKKLLDDLNKVANRFSCPHGRPTGWLLTSYEIERKFKRKL